MSLPMTRKRIPGRRSTGGDLFWGVQKRGFGAIFFAQLLGLSLVRLISWHIVGVVKVIFKIVFPNQTLAFFTLLPYSWMAVIVMKMADTLVLVMILAIASTFYRCKRSITANPLVTTLCFYQGSRIVSTKSTMLARDYFRFQPIIRHWGTLNIFSNIWVHHNKMPSMAQECWLKKIIISCISIYFISKRWLLLWVKFQN